MPENPAFALPDIDPALPNVLLIGDSISIGYTLPVRAQLTGRANVLRPLINCGATIRALELLDEWLGDQDWAVIHFNFGLHDLKYVDDAGQMADPPKSGRQFVPIDEYESNLNQIVVRLQQTGARLIWCNTTPVPDGASGRIKGDADRYNEAASRVATKHGLALDNLYSFALERLDSIQQPANVHFTDDGSVALGTQVVTTILEVL
jgi:acyl-CoA thioesterase-1